MNQSFHLTNVRRFHGHHELSLAPLTLIYGNGSTGKSTLLDAMAAFRSTLPPVYRTGSTLARQAADLGLTNDLRAGSLAPLRSWNPSNEELMSVGWDVDGLSVHVDEHGDWSWSIAGGLLRVKDRFGSFGIGHRTLERMPGLNDWIISRLSGYVARAMAAMDHVGGWNPDDALSVADMLSSIAAPAEGGFLITVLEHVRDEISEHLDGYPLPQRPDQLAKFVARLHQASDADLLPTAWACQLTPYLSDWCNYGRGTRNDPQDPYGSGWSPTRLDPQYLARFILGALSCHWAYDIHAVAESLGVWGSASHHRPVSQPLERMYAADDPNLPRILQNIAVPGAVRVLSAVLGRKVSVGIADVAGNLIYTQDCPDDLGVQSHSNLSRAFARHRQRPTLMDLLQQQGRRMPTGFVIPVLIEAGGAQTPIAYHGYGVQVLVGMLAHMTGMGLSLVQQPETHLHPKQQFDLGRALWTLIGNGSTVVAETHSEYLLRGVQSMLRDSPSAASSVLVHEVRSMPDDDGSFIRTHCLEPNGDFNLPWPDEFFPDPRLLV